MRWLLSFPYRVPFGSGPDSGPGNSGAAQWCKTHFDDAGRGDPFPFKNRGQCVSYFARGGTLEELTQSTTGDETATVTTTGDETATITTTADEQHGKSGESHGKDKSSTESTGKKGGGKKK